jgi:uncharacterized membrane protein
MDATHLHLLLNHFPIIGTLIGTVIIIYGFIKNESKIKELSAYIIAAMALIALPVFLLGNQLKKASKILQALLNRQSNYMRKQLN